MAGVDKDGLAGAKIILFTLNADTVMRFSFAISRINE
jgi:hypothetical protein